MFSILDYDEEIAYEKAQHDSRQRIHELKKAKKAALGRGGLPDFPIAVDDPEPPSEPMPMPELDMKATFKFVPEAGKDTTRNLVESESPVEKAQDRFEAPTPFQDPKGHQKLTERGESSTQPKKQKTLPTFLTPVNDNPDYATIVRSAGGTYYELSCYVCRGNASAFLGSAIKPKFLQGSRGIQRHISRTHANLYKTPFTEQDVKEQCISRKLTNKEAKAVDKGTYQVKARRTAKANVARTEAVKSKRPEQNGEKAQKMASGEERQYSKVPAEEPSPGLRARSTAPGGPGNPSGFWSSDNALPTCDSESGY